MILFVMSTLGQEINSVKFYDKYNGEVSLANFDRYVIITCDTLQIPCVSGQTVQLVFRNKSVAKTECKARVTFQLPISEMHFGEYWCESNGAKYEKSLNFNYRLCNDEECTSSSCNEKDFCVVEAGSPQGCRMDKERCSETLIGSGDQFCAGKVTSLCDAVATGVHSKTWVKQQVSCHSSEEKDHYLRVQYGGNTRSYNEPIEIDIDRSKIAIHCPSDPPNMQLLKLTCVFKGSDGTVVHSDKKDQIDLGLQVPIAPLFNHGSRVFKMECDLGGKYNLSNYLIFMGGKAEVKPNEKNGFTDSLECNLDPPPGPGPEFKVTYTWTTPDGKKEGQTLAVYKDGNYTCHEEVKYKKCTPVVKIDAKEFSSGVVQAKVDPAKTPPPTTAEKWTGSPTPSPDGAKGRATDSGVSMAAIIGGAVAGVVVLLVVVIVVVVFMMLRRRAKQQEAKHLALAAQIQEVQAAGVTKEQLNEQLDAKLRSVESKIKNQVDQAFHDQKERDDRGRELHPQAKAMMESRDSMDVQQLRQQIVKYAALDERGQFEFMNTNFNVPAEKREKKARVHELTTCRYSATRLGKILNDSQFKLPGESKEGPGKLHLSIVPDAHGDPIHLGQAPLPTESYYHYQAIWHAKVGVIVVVGKLEEQGHKKIDQYWPTDIKKPMQFTKPPGRNPKLAFRVTLISMIPDENGCNTYVLNVENLETNESRQVTLIHIAEWPDHNIPRQPSAVCKAIVQMMNQHTLREKSGLPGMSVHCSAGFQRSPTVVAMYIGYQGYLKYKKVNPIGLLQYVRLYRMNVLSCGRKQKLPECVDRILPTVHG